MALHELLERIRLCQECEPHLPLGPRPIVQASIEARILIIGQAPGRQVHESGVPWNDPSGIRLRKWMGISHEQFYDPSVVALMSMGFCYPGSGTSGDLPPRKECARQWHDELLAQLTNIELTLLVGQYAQSHYLTSAQGVSLTSSVLNWQTVAPAMFPLPHPSPRNNRWFKSNPWFAEQLLPELRRATSEILEKAG